MKDATVRALALIVVGALMLIPLALAFGLDSISPWLYRAARILFPMAFPR